MAYKQPRVPEYRESEGVSGYMRPLILFLRDFSAASWKANNQRIREIGRVNARIDGLPEPPEIAYPVTSVNGKTGEVTLGYEDVGALGKGEKAADSACFEGKTWQQMLDALHPVGCVYISLEPTSPAERFGGAWERIEDVFLLGAGAAHEAESTGGEEEHTLTIDEMPSHNHSKTISNVESSGIYDSKWMNASSSTSSSKTGAIGYAGGGLAHNNMPPYLTAYMWRRVE